MITCPANEMHNHTDNFDLDDSIYKGFTVGKRGRVMYWYFIWHENTGNASIFTAEMPMRRAYIKGNQIINIHLK